MRPFWNPGNEPNDVLSRFLINTTNKNIYKYNFVCFGANTGQKRLNMVAILKFKLAAEDTFEKMDATQVLFVRIFER